MESYKKFIKVVVAAVSFMGASIVSSAEAYSPPPTTPPEYTEVNTGNGTLILKRGSDADVVVKPLVCIYFSGTAFGGAIPPSGFVVAYSYTSSCVGVHTFDYKTRVPSSGSFGLALQRLISGTWTTVATGVSSISYFSGPTGSYRLLATNAGGTATTSFSIDYKVPN